MAGAYQGGAQGVLKVGRTGCPGDQRHRPLCAPPALRHMRRPPAPSRLCVPQPCVKDTKAGPGTGAARPSSWTNADPTDQACAIPERLIRKARRRRVNQTHVSKTARECRKSNP